MPSIWIRHAWILTAGVLLGGCHSQPPLPSPPPEDGIIRIRTLENPTTLDPAFATRALDGHLACLVHAGLVRCSSQGQIIPELLSAWESLEGGKRYRFRLLENLRFPSGSEVTSEDVVFSFSRLCAKKTTSPHAWLFEDVQGYREVLEGESERLAGIRVIDSHQFEVELAAPSATLPARLTMPAARIVDSRAVLKEGNHYGRKPSALGAWEVLEWVDDSHVSLQPNPLYPAHNRHLKGIRFTLAPQDFSACALFETGGLHILQPLPLTQAARWKAFPIWRDRIMRVRELNVYYLGFGCHRYPLDQIKVRQALVRYIHPEAFRKALFGNRTEPAHGPIPPGLPGHLLSEPVELPPLDPSALDILRQKELELWFIESEASISLAMEAIQANLTAAGIRCRLRKTDAATYAAWRREGKFDLFFANWWADYPDPDNFLAPLFKTGSTSNMTRYTDPETDRLIQQVAIETDPQKRESDAQEASRRIIDAAPAVFLWHRNTEIISQPWVQGLDPSPLFHATLFLDLRIGKPASHLLGSR